MRKKNAFIATILLGSVVLGGAAATISVSTNLAQQANAKAGSLTLNGDTVFTDTIATVKTENNNTVQIVSSGNGLTLATGEAIYNSDMIQGLTSVQIALTSGSVEIQGDYETGLPRNRVLANINSSSTVEFNQGMRYFKIVAKENTVISSIKLSYDCPADIPYNTVDGVLMDGYGDDPSYGASFKTTKAVCGSGDYRTDIYATKTTGGLHIYAEQFVATTRYHAEKWWENNNIEFRFGNYIKVPDVNGNQQYWFSSLNGGSKSHGELAYKEVGVVDGLNKLQFEIYIPWSQLPVKYDQNVIFTAGVAYSNGFVGMNTWNKVRADQYNQYDEITATGVQKFAEIGSNFFERTGTELLASPKSITYDQLPENHWNSNVASVTLDGSKSFEIRVDLHSSYAGQEYNDCGYVGEIFSPGWSNGGWTFRQDWWGWGSWSYTGGECPAGSHGDFINCAENNMFTAMREKDVVLFAKFDAEIGRIGIKAMYTSTYEGYVGAKMYVAYYSGNISYRGDMIASFGVCNGAATFNSIQLISGTSK